MSSSNRIIAVTLSLMAFWGMCSRAYAVTYNWMGGSQWSDLYNNPELYLDDLGNNPTLEEMTDASLGGVFYVVDTERCGLAGATFTFDAPFICMQTDPNRSPFRVLQIDTMLDPEDERPPVYTFNNMRFRGGINIDNPVSSTIEPFRIAGRMTVIDKFKIDTRGPSSPGGAWPDAWFDIMIDASRVDLLEVLWVDKSGGGNESRIRLNNPDNAFWGKWVLTTQLFADADGSLGDADVDILGIGAGRSGILRINSPGAISENAEVMITMGNTPNPPTRGKIITDEDITVRKLVVSGNVVPAGTYNTGSGTVGGANITTWFSGSGSITVLNVDAGNILSVATNLETEDDLGLMPRVGIEKAYMGGYEARIRAPEMVTADGINYFFARWEGDGIDDVDSSDTTVLMDSSKTVTAIYALPPEAHTPVPADKSGNVSTTTTLSWTPYTEAETQEVWFGASQGSMTMVASGGGSLSSVDNASLGGPLEELSSYYWRVVTNGEPGPVWVFMTGRIIAQNPSPADGETEVPVDNVQMTWEPGDPGATGYNVYFGTDRAAVENGEAPMVNISDPYMDLTTLERGQWYYWRVDCIYPGKTVVGDVWSFRCESYKIYIDTDTLTLNAEFGSPVVQIVADDDDIAIYKFDDFTYNHQWDIIVSGRRRLAIWSDNDMSFGGVLDVSAPDNDSNIPGTAMAGGYMGGEKHTIVHANPQDPNYPEEEWPAYAWYPPDHTYTTRYYWVRDEGGTYAQYPDNAPMTPEIHGPGHPKVWADYYPPSGGGVKLRVHPTVGGGAGYGGPGGNSSTMADNAGQPYGQKELLELWGGSGGAGGGTYIDWVFYCARAGAGGGGVIEMYTKGNLTIGPDAQLLAGGGSTLHDGTEGPDSLQNGGGGSGGSIRLAAHGNVSIQGRVAADGGRGAGVHGIKTTGNLAGGGGGGRIAIYRGGSLTNTGLVSTYGGQGGRRLLYTDTERLDGQNGTIYGLAPGEGNISRLFEAHFPAPADGASSVEYGPSETLQWKPGLGSKQNIVYIGTESGNLAQVAEVTAEAGNYLRALQSVDVTLEFGTRYFWRVECDGVMGPLWTFRTIGNDPKNPNPPTGDVGIDIYQPVLGWEMGVADANLFQKWDVYFGDDQMAVINATPSDPEFYGSVTNMDTPWWVVPMTLETETTYYWRVDEHNDEYWDGLVWNFTTRPVFCRGILYGDLDGDCKVTFADFARFAQHWGEDNLYVDEEEEEPQ